jgi:hypothetical protein
VNEQIPNQSQPQNSLTQSPRKSPPVGVILILVLTGFAALGDLSSIINPVLVLGGLVITGPAAALWYLVELAVMIALFVGLLKRLEWGRILGIAVSAYKIILPTLAAAAYVMNPERMQDVIDRVAPGYEDMVPASFMLMVVGISAIMGWIVGAAVIVYLISKKSYFVSAGEPSQPLQTGPSQ